jgi:A/G-specific adenine glycosylase
MSEPPGSEWVPERHQADDPPFDAQWGAVPEPVAHGFTHFELRLSIFRADLGQEAAAPPGHWWAPAGSLPDQALPNVMKKAIEAAFPGATKPAKGTA